MRRNWCAAILALSIGTLASGAAAHVDVAIDPDGDGLPGVHNAAAFAPNGLSDPGATAEDMAGNAWAGTSYAFDSSTGAGRTLGASGTSTLNASSPTGDGRIYAAGRGGTLWIVDPSTGQATSAASISLADVRGLALASSGKLYAVNEIAFGQPDVLHSIDPNSGASEEIGSMNLPGV